MSQYIRGEKYVWHLPLMQDKQAADIAGNYNLAIPIAQTLLSRGFTSKATIDDYLFSTYEKDVEQAHLLKDAQKAVDRIMKAIKKQEKILICGDYDVDGVTSSALMMMCLLPLSAQVNFFLPHRVKDGYGLSTAIVQKASNNGYTLIITVDNGISAFDAAALAQQLSIDLIITDHHKPHASVPKAYAIVNPNQVDCHYPYKYFAGVGVAFKVMLLLYETLGKTIPAKVYELLLLGTIADVVPLTGENRFWVRYGLQCINKTQSNSFKALKSNGKLTKTIIGATDIGFCIAPQINALGRLEDARQGVRFLIGKDQQEVETVAATLLELNETRKIIERTMYEEIKEKIRQGNIDITKEWCIITSSNTWPPGVIGLVASRLVSVYARPAILLHEGKDGIIKGSCRSIPEFNIFNALDKLRDILIQFGGHPAAAGLSLKAEHLPLFKEKMQALCASQLKPEDLVPKIKLDALLHLSDISQKFMRDMHYLEPFGHGNSAPCFYIKQVSQVQKPKLLKEVHVKILIFANGIIKPVMFFNRPELYEKLLAHKDNPISIAAQVTENYWNERSSIELTGIDIIFGE